ncbi:hypothetical protein [Flavobacterium sp. H122]|uniref:hypothetical protein n=1 Tax=Flavobacterium sp. H122 TaxID=2529860 RepID=UPI00145B0FEA|nr:hypothetical protein [Flavobacterium sp. H122]
MMQNRYNKGRFRGHEYGKIPPYLKKLGNKKWRRTPIEETKLLPTELFFETKVQLPTKASKSKERIKVKITFLEFNQVKSTKHVTYKNIKSLKDSIKRNNVINVVDTNKKIQIHK